MLSERLDMRISPEQKECWVAYAKMAGISIGELVRTSVDREINQTLCEHERQDKDKHQF